MMSPPLVNDCLWVCDEESFEVLCTLLTDVTELLPPGPKEF